LFSSIEAQEFPELLKEDFEKGADRWQPTDPKAWKIEEAPGGGKVFFQFSASGYKPPFRSPFNYALLKDVVVGDFVLDLEAKSTSPKAGNHRDVCLIFGHQSNTKFYYIHVAGLSGANDPRANQVFIVNEAERKKLESSVSRHAKPWDDAFHKIRIVRKVSDGSIKLYFDDLEKPVIEANDKTFTWGQVGVGTFDDTAQFDNIRLRGVKVTQPAK
jgi:hypothetical protein